MRVLILTCSTGGGHDMRAHAFRHWAEREAAGIEVELHRPLESSHWLYHFGVGLYNWIQRTAPFLHHVYFNFLEVVPIVRTQKPLGAPRFRAVLEQTRPDVLFSVHDSLNHGFFEYAREVLGADRVRCVTYCGELDGGYGFSRHWVNPAADLFIGPTFEVCETAVRLGMPRARTMLGGFLLRPGFYDPPPDAEARRAFIAEELKLDPDKFTLLLRASGHGANNHLAFLDALAREKIDAQIVALCGKSEEAAARVRAWADAHPAMRVRVLPPNADMAKLMRCVSAIVARGAASGVSEAIASQCPLFVNGLGGVMPQEQITVKYCRRHGLAELIRRPADLSLALKRWMATPGILNDHRARLRAVCPRAHPRDIVRAVTGIAAPASQSVVAV